MSNRVTEVNLHCFITFEAKEVLFCTLKMMINTYMDLL